MTATSPGLTELDRPSAVFKAGQTALGHRWILQDENDAEVGHTKLFYERSGKTFGRLMRVTGLSTSGQIHAAVLSAEGAELYKVHSRPGKDARVDITDGDGTPIGWARRRDLSLELFGHESVTALATIVRTSKDDLGFPIEGTAGERLGVLTKRKLETSAPSITQMVFLPQVASNTIAFQATMHLGFSGSL